VFSLSEGTPTHRPSRECASTSRHHCLEPDARGEHLGPRPSGRTPGGRRGQSDSYGEGSPEVLRPPNPAQFTRIDPVDAVISVSNATMDKHSAPFDAADERRKDPPRLYDLKESEDNRFFQHDVWWIDRRSPHRVCGLALRLRDKTWLHNVKVMLVSYQALRRNEVSFDYVNEMASNLITGGRYGWRCRATAQLFRIRLLQRSARVSFRPSA
jgi:hypothetical protein